MRTIAILLLVFTFCHCKDSLDPDALNVSSDSAKANEMEQDSLVNNDNKGKRITILVLPPFDEIANEGISPNLQRIIEETIKTDTSFDLIEFPYQRLMNVAYHNVFDKRYCDPITDVIKADFLVMTKLIQVVKTGNMKTDKWSFQMKIYNTVSDSQFISTVAGNGLSSAGIEKYIEFRKPDLFMEIKNNRKKTKNLK